MFNNDLLARFISPAMEPGLLMKKKSRIHELWIDFVLNM